jgi:hypothetical protein
MMRMFIPIFPAVLALYWPFCTPELRPSQPTALVQIEELWERPDDIGQSDLFSGPWGREHAPADADDEPYRFVKPKTTGLNPGMTVTDRQGREWSVKQASHDPDRGDEGPVEVVLSRVLSAVGYHQPPVYYVRSFTLEDSFGSRTEPGGRFRLDHPSLKNRGTWSWQQNPFVGTRPYQGLLAILVMFNSSDLKNSNNTLYEQRTEGGPRRLFVVRDLGMALGNTGRFTPRRGDPELFEKEPFIDGVEGDMVRFNYRGWHQELIDRRITRADVIWASDLLGQLRIDQWRDAFCAGGYDTVTAERFIQRLLAKIREGRDLGARSTGDRP